MAENLETEKSELSQSKIAIVDDHELVRLGMQSILTNNGFKNVKGFSCAEDLISKMGCDNYFDFYIIDIELPDNDGFVLIEMIRARHPEAKIIVSTVHDEIWTVRKLLVRNVNSIIYKTGNGHEILNAISEINQGRVYYCDAVRDILKSAGDGTLHPTARELEVLSQIAQGKTSKEIAAPIFVSENTVEAHRKALFSKLGAINVVDLIVKAISKGYITKTGAKP